MCYIGHVFKENMYTSPRILVNVCSCVCVNDGYQCNHMYDLFN